MLKWLNKLFCSEVEVRDKRNWNQSTYQVEVPKPFPTEVEKEFLQALGNNRVELKPDPRPLKYVEDYFVLGEYEFRLGSGNEGYFYKQEKYLWKIRPAYHSGIAFKLYTQDKVDIKKSLQEDFIKEE